MNFNFSNSYSSTRIPVFARNVFATSHPLAAQAGMVRPMSTILMGVVILGEPFTVWVIAGTVLVITGIFVFTSRGRSDSG